MKDDSFDQPQSLMKRTQAMLKKKDLLGIYHDTGLPFYWLRKFAGGEIKNPSVNRVQFLHEHLSGKKLPA